MKKYLYFQLQVLLSLALEISSWQYFTSLSDMVLLSSQLEPEMIHSDYFYGHCKSKDLKFYTHIHKDHMDILGKIIVRGWITVPRIPTCILLRATAYEADMFRSTAFPFQLCVPRILYCHSKKRIKYFYYEWYLPYDMIGGMNWDIYFYGPVELTWQ